MQTVKEGTFSAQSNPSFGAKRGQSKEQEGKPIEELTGEITCAVSASANLRNKMMDNWAQGRGVFLTTPGRSSALEVALTFGLRLLWFEKPGKVAPSGSGSVIPPVTGTRRPPRRGASSSGAVVAAMVTRQLGENSKTSVRRMEGERG